ncbi:hypothetical protein BLNAU_8075 [Blattamonas nauphoetae]|uniref:Uncharacterized protein n=1 Tax=Blattamonas nauphoetae TaxID=2049346 RepID=A0ABQ9XZU5_9EUKA|nr:hypothetical protein BLNAU_8075 [Blattamonas nauphoetae]
MMAPFNSNQKQVELKGVVDCWRALDWSAQLAWNERSTVDSSFTPTSTVFPRYHHRRTPLAQCDPLSDATVHPPSVPQRGMGWKRDQKMMNTSNSGKTPFFSDCCALSLARHSSGHPKQMGTILRLSRRQTSSTF